MTCTKGCSRNGRLNKGVPTLDMDDVVDHHWAMFQEDPVISLKRCDKCNLFVTKHQTTITAGKEPLILPIVFDQTSFSARLLADELMDTLVVSGQHFDLKQIIVNQRARGHYMSLIKHQNGKWLAYDGLHHGPARKKEPKQGKANHFRLAKTSDWCNEYSKVFSVEYIRNHDKTLALQKEAAKQAEIAASTTV